MLITTPVDNELVEISSTAPTVVAPGETLDIQIEITARHSCELMGIDWKTPAVINPKPESADLVFPHKLQTGQKFYGYFQFSTRANEEGYGEISATLKLKTTDGEVMPVEWSAWLSVFKLERASDTEPLSTELRQRLIDVVNARIRNGHIFLADYISFFVNFLNIQVPERIAGIISEDFGLPSEGLPVDLETLKLIILGDKTFYGITKLELVAEEDCTESDDKFVLDASRELEAERMDDA